MACNPAVSPIKFPNGTRLRFLLLSMPSGSVIKCIDTYTGKVSDGEMYVISHLSFDHTVFLCMSLHT